MVLGARDDPRLVVGGQPHRLRLVELWILKRRQTKQPVSQPGGKSVLGDVDLVAEDQFQDWLGTSPEWRSFGRREGGAVHGSVIVVFGR